MPLWIVAGGAADRRPLYTTEGGWLHIDESALIEDALAAREKGFTGSKIKIVVRMSQSKSLPEFSLAFGKGGTA